MNAVETEFLEKIEIEVREVGDGVEPWRRVGSAEAGMLRDDHVERRGQPTHEGQPGSGTAAAVEKEHRTTGAAAHDTDAAVPDQDCRDGMIGHSPPRLAFPTGQRPFAGYYASRISSTYTLTCGSIDCDGRQHMCPRRGRVARFRSPKGNFDVCASRSEDEHGLSDPGHHESMGARRSRPAVVDGQAGAGTEESRGAGAHRRSRNLRDRSGDHLSRTARVDPRRHAAQQELYPRTRIYGHGGRARTGS